MLHVLRRASTSVAALAILGCADSPVEPFEVNGKTGLRAVIGCGISDPETGFHAGAGECLWAVVSDGAQSVVISSSGFGNGLEAAEAAVRSIRFAID